MALKSLHWLRSNSFSLGPLDFSGGIGIPMGCINTEAIGIPIPPRISWGGRIPMGYGKSNGVLEFQWAHWNSKDGPYCHSEKWCKQWSRSGCHSVKKSLHKSSSFRRESITKLPILHSLIHLYTDICQSLSES